MTSVPQQTIKKWRQIANRLVHGTLSGSVIWEDGPQKNQIVTTIGDLTVSVFEMEADVLVQVSDTFGEEIDSFRQREVYEPFDQARNSLSEMFRIARRRISGADEALDRLISALPPDPDEIPF